MSGIKADTQNQPRIYSGTMEQIISNSLKFQTDRSGHGINKRQKKKKKNIIDVPIPKIDKK